MPTLLIVGTESPAWAVRSVDAYAGAIPGAETLVLEGEGHSATVTAPGLLAAELGRFLSVA
jgi:pimeloyl-ACP methyl ester carboxylesterase